MNAWNHRCASRLWLGGYIGLTIALTISGAWAQAGLPPPPTIAGLKAESTAPLSYIVDERVGTLNWLQGSFTPLAPGDPAGSAYAFMEKHREAFKIDDPRSEFTVMLSKKGLLVNDDHVYLEQRIKGLPVWNRRLGFHYDKQGRLYAVNGKYAAVPKQALNTKPTLTKEEAFVIATEDFKKNPNKAPAGTTSAQWPASSHPLPIDQQIPCYGELMFYQDSADNLRLAYYITFSISAPPGDWVYFVDAVTGSVLMKYNLIMTAGPAVGSGLDLYNNVVPLNTYLDTDGKYKLIDTTKAMYTQHSTPSNTTFAGCIEIRDAAHNQNPPINCSVVSDPDGDNVFTYGGSDPKQNYQPAVSLSRNLSSTYDLFASLYNRNSLDGKGLSMVAHSHLGTKYQNAYWQPWTSMMYFGDNDDNGWPYARGAEVVCHEAAHGINTFEVPPYGYTYHRQSGAINDSHSDISGAMIDYGNWNVGEDVAKDGQPMRRFDDPTAVDSPQPKDMYDYQMMTDDVDGGGNHCDCSIGNYFVYQLAMRLPAEAPASDGRFTAGRIAYRSYVYGTANPEVTWREWGQYIKQAAVDLYGPGDIYAKVVEALDVVHIPQALFGINDNWTYKLGDDGYPFYFWLQRIGYPCWPVVSARFTRPSTNAKLKTVAMNLENLGSCKYRIWYLGAKADGSPDETVYQLLFDNRSPSGIRADGIFTNFMLADSISVASDFHVALDLYDGTYLGIRYDTGNPATERSWFKYYNAYGQVAWYKIKEYFTANGQTLDPNLLIRVIYDSTPSNAPCAPTLVSPANGETINNWLVTFSWNAVSGADRYFLEANSSPSWASATRVYFGNVSDTSKQTSGFPVGVNYWRVWAGNADAWSSVSETRSFTELASPPQLACSATNLAARAAYGQNAAGQSFDVWNSGNGSISYSITENCDWLSVTPCSGASSGERDAIQVTYNTCGLAAGNNTATITVTASGAVGSPATIAVTLTVISASAGLPVAGDFDGDGLADPAIVSASGWYIWMSEGGYSRLGPVPLTSAGATPVAADFDGDRKADPTGVDASGNWTICMSSGGYAPIGPVHLTAGGSTPVAADFDGDGKADPSAMDSAGNWTICLSSEGYTALGPLPLTVSGGTPIAADFDGDGKADPTVVDSCGKWTICSSLAGYTLLGPFALTSANLMAVAGDFDGDRKADPTAIDSSGNWTICMSQGGYAPQGPFPMTVP